MAQDEYDLEFVLNELNREYEQHDLDVNMEKTEYLEANTDALF